MALKDIQGVAIASVKTWGVTAAASIGSVGASGGGSWPHGSASGQLWMWGFNHLGRLGLGNTTNYSSPMQVGSLTDWNKLCGTQSTGALKTDYTLWSWGQGSNGQLGIGNITNYYSPKQVGSLTNWKELAAGEQCRLAIKTDGTLWSWGFGGDGRLGLGNTTNYSSPKQVGSLTNWSKISAYNHVVAIKTDGTLWTWGRNTSGQLGLGNVTSYSSPKQVGSLTNWSSISGSVGGYRTLATKTDGTLWSWGNNNNGQLGLGNTTAYSSPKQVGSLTNWLTDSTTAIWYSSAAIKTDGTLWTWGRNTSGQLGLGNTTAYSSPKQVGSLTNWIETAGGSYAFKARKTDGTLWSWGSGSTGQLGLGNITNYSSPKQIGILTSWIALGKGLSFWGAGIKTS